MPTPLEQLDRAREEVLAASGTDFLRRLGEYVRLLQTDETIKAEVEAMRQAVLDADEQLEREDADFVAKLIPIRKRLAEEEPEVDDSALPWPGPYKGGDPRSAEEFREWGYTLANFDAIAAESKEVVRVEHEGDQLNTSRTQMLVSILKAKLYDLVFDFNEKTAARPDLMPLYDEMSDVGIEQTNAYRRVEHVADQNGWFALNWLDAVAEAMQPRERRSLKTSDAKREVLEEALRKPDLFALPEIMRPRGARGSLSDKEKETVARLEETSRAELDHLHRPLRERVAARVESEVATTETKRTPLSRIEKLTAWQVALAVLALILAAAAIVIPIVTAG